jgi:hypothetical protein
MQSPFMLAFAPVSLQRSRSNIPRRTCERRFQLLDCALSRVCGADTAQSRGLTVRFVPSPSSALNSALPSRRLLLSDLMLGKVVSEARRRSSATPLGFSQWNESPA